MPRAFPPWAARLSLAFFLAWLPLVPARAAAASAGALTDAGFFAQLNSIQAQVPRAAMPPAVLPPGLPPAAIEAAQKQDLLSVGNDNGKDASSYIEFSLGLDAAGRILTLSFTPSDDPGRRRDFSLNDALRSCSVRGSKRLSRDNACGVELFHAIFDTSAIRLLAPELSAEAGGVITIIYLKHYSLLGKSREAELNIRLRRRGAQASSSSAPGAAPYRARRDSGGWGLYLAGDDPGSDPAPASARIEGLFIHRGRRGIDVIIPCLGGDCPASWQRPYQENKGLPPVYTAAGP